MCISRVLRAKVYKVLFTENVKELALKYSTKELRRLKLPGYKEALFLAKFYPRYSYWYFNP